MYTLEELKKASNTQKKDTTVGSSKEDVLYQKYLENRKKQPKVSGGTANPIWITADVQENHNLTPRKSLTYAEALEKNKRTTAQLGKGLEQAKATVQDVKDILFSGRNYGSVNPTFSYGKEYDTMTENEAGIYTSLTKQGKKAEAESYLKALQMELNARNAEITREQAKQTAQRSVLGGVGLDVVGAISGGAGTAYGLWKEAKGEAIDPYHLAFGGVALQEGASEGLLGDSTGAKKLLKQAALATAEWGGQVLAYGPFMPVAQAAGAAGSSMKDAAERGGTAEEAAFYGLASGAAEVVTEKIGFERYLGMIDKIAPMKGNRAELAKYILKQMASEGLEEGSSEIANMLADIAIMGDKSEMKRLYHTAKESGMTEKQAAWAAMKAAAGQVGESFAVGALSGGAISGGLVGIDAATGRDPLARVREQYEAATKVQELPLQESAAEMWKNAAENAADVGKVDKSVDNGTGVPTGQKAATDTVSKELEAYSEKYYGAKGKEVYLKKAQESGSLNHTEAFNTYYRAGIAGLAEKEIKPTAYMAVADKMLLNEAYMAGTEDRRTELANAINGKNRFTGERGLILGEDVKATEAQLAITKLYTDIGGAKIRLVNHIDAGEEIHVNGMQEGDTITIALDADSFTGTMHHEMIHYIKRVNPEGYDALREVVFRLANESGIDIDAQMEAYRNSYKEVYGEDAEMTAFMEEITADAFEKLTADGKKLKGMLTELYHKDKTLLERIKEFLEKMAETLQSLLKDNTYTAFAEEISKDEENVRKLQKAFAKVLTETGKMDTQTEESGAKYAIKHTENNQPFVEIEEDILNGVPKKEWAKTVKKTLKTKFPNGVQIRNENIRINGRQTASEMTKSKYAQWLAINSPAEYADKLRLVNNTDEILYTAQNWKGEKINHSRKDNIVEFARAEALIRISNRGYSADVVVGTTSDSGMVLYDILYLKPVLINEKKQEQTAVHSKKKISTEIVAPVSKNSIAQDEGENNNKNVTKFSLKKSVEETKNLIAVHNLTEENLKGTLELGGFPMPSIAIVKDNMGHEKYGDISLVFGKETIDPQADKRNAVYGGDAWTPTVPQVDYPVDSETKRRIEKEIGGLAEKVAGGIFKKSSILSMLGVDEDTNLTQRELAEKLAGQDAVRAAYLAEQGKDIEPIYKKKVYDRCGNDFLQKIIDHFGEQELARLAVKRNLGESLDMEDIAPIREIWKQRYINTLPSTIKKKKTPEQIAAKAEEQAEKMVDAWQAGVFAEHAWQMYEEGGGTSEEVDNLATSDKLREEVKHDAVIDWIEGKLEGLLGEGAIYNGKEPYTASGNRRSFAQLHYAYTLENLVKAMREGQKERGENLWGVSAKGLQSVATPAYKSIDEIKADKGRLQIESEEEYEAALEEMDEKIGTIIQKIKDTNEAHSSNSFMESDIIGSVLIDAAGRSTARGVKNHFAEEGYQITDRMAKEIVELYQAAANMPTGYFEAKPRRAVGLEEIKAAIVPDGMNAELKNQLEGRGIETIEYTAGDSKSRLAALNSVRDVKFSIRKIASGKKEYGVGVVLDTNIFDGVKTRNWGRILRDYVYKNMPKGTMTNIKEQ